MTLVLKESVLGLKSIIKILFQCVRRFLKLFRKLVNADPASQVCEMELWKLNRRFDWPFWV